MDSLIRYFSSASRSFLRCRTCNLRGSMAIPFTPAIHPLSADCSQWAGLIAMCYWRASFWKLIKEGVGYLKTFPYLCGINFTQYAPGAGGDSCMPTPVPQSFQGQMYREFSTLPIDL